MFRDDHQTGACCRALLARVDRAEWWGEDGRPTAEVCELVDAGAGGLAAGERALLHLAFALWNGWEAGRMRELLSLDADNLATVGELLTALALGPEAVDTWLDEHGGGADRTDSHRERAMRAMRARNFFVSEDEDEDAPQDEQTMDERVAEVRALEGRIRAAVNRSARLMSGRGEDPEG